MVSADGRYVIVFNGEIYNHGELRVELEHSGRGGWRGHSDTEVMLAGFSAWGVHGTLRKLVGMFAIALWDRAERRLHLVRDRMGEKPLYYGWCQGAFVFASELKAFKRHGAFAPDVDRRALASFLRYMYVPAPYTIYSGVYKLEPGCVLTLGAGDMHGVPAGSQPRAPLRAGGLTLDRWWALSEAVAAPTSPAAEADMLTMLETTLRDAVRLQSVADVPLGAFLSGGVDSSLIACLMQSECGSRLRTFTIGFREQQYDEAPHAAAVAKHLGTEHIELYVGASDALAAVEKLPRLYDEPFADSSQIPTFLLCSQARKHLTVAVSGDAGDELFGGYNRYVWVPRIWRRLASLPPAARHAAARAALAVPPAQWDRVYGAARRFMPGSSLVALAGHKVHKLAERVQGATDPLGLFYNLVSEWKQPSEVVIGAEEHDTLLTRPEAWPRLDDVEQQMMYLDAMTYLPDDILVKVDRAAMGTSLETRAPFLDHRVVEAAWTLPLHMKLRDGQGKWALRQILYKYVPRELIERPKQGFGIPLGEWLRGPLRGWAENLLSETRLRGEGYFRPEPIRVKWREHLAGVRNWDQALWSVLMFQAWSASP
jgi:asparagine synthase (glutamine-hydrolysing)